MDVARLYHGMPMPPTGEALVPATKYGMFISDSTRAALGLPTSATHPPLVFATPHLRHATAFATTGLINAMLFGLYALPQQSYFAIFCDRERFLSATLSGVVHAFAATGFAQVANSPNHFVSTKAVPFTATERAVEVTCVADALRTGLQIFTVREPPPRKPGDPVPYGYFNDLKFPTGLAPLIAAGKVFWENYEQGIAPDPFLLDAFREVLPRPASFLTP